MKLKHTLLYSSIKAMTLAIGMAMIASCSDNSPLPDKEGAGEGKHPVVVKLGGAYSLLSRATQNPGLDNSMIHSLPNGSTLRLIVLQNVDTDNLLTIQEGNIKAQMTYVVRTDEGGAQSLYPCDITEDADGKLIISNERLTPYFFEDNENQSLSCMAISPAKVLHEDTDGFFKVAVKNQETVLTTNNHWEQTQVQPIIIPEADNEPVVIELNPLMFTSARIKVTMQNGQGITSLVSTVPGIEIDRVPTNPGKTWTSYDKDNNGNLTSNTNTMPTYNLAIGDTIVAQMGNNILYNRLYIDNDSCKVTESVWAEGYYDSKGNPTATETKWHENGDRKKIQISGETTILPMDARPTPMIIVINAIVNDVPMQFQYQVNENFRPGHSYNYMATIHIKEGQIYIAAWQDMSWNYETEPDSETNP